MFRTKLEMLKLTKGNNSKIRTKKLVFLCTAHLPIEIYSHTKFHVDISYSFRVMSQTRFSTRGDNLKTGQNRVMVL
jgi:hypothetical protein